MLGCWGTLPKCHGRFDDWNPLIMEAVSDQEQAHNYPSWSHESHGCFRTAGGYCWVISPPSWCPMMSKCKPQIHTCNLKYSPFGSVSKPCTPGEHQNSWDLWISFPLKMVLIGIDPYPFDCARSADSIWLLRKQRLDCLDPIITLALLLIACSLVTDELILEWSKLDVQNWNS